MVYSTAIQSQTLYGIMFAYMNDENTWHSSCFQYSNIWHLLVLLLRHKFWETFSWDEISLIQYIKHIFYFLVKPVLLDNQQSGIWLSPGKQITLIFSRDFHTHLQSSVCPTSFLKCRPGKKLPIINYRENIGYQVDSWCKWSHLTHSPHPPAHNPIHTSTQTR